ncbi:MAG TPA: hypothetical protein PKL63_14025 [Dermatophilaceae bacterium]|nr:hypothetical protein [Dermatophilaceae bacterium]
MLNDDGAWSWFEDERAIIHNGKLIAGSVAAGRWFARQVLPHLTAELVAARLLDEEPLLLPDASL